MKFSEMTYTRPDINALLARCKQLAAKAADAQDGDALIQVYYEQSRAFADYTTASQLANIHYTCDTRDAYWKAEQDFFDANGPAVTNASVEISRAFLANPYVDALTEHFGTTCVAGMKNAVLGMDDRTIDLQKEYNALVSQYQQVYGSALVEFDGKPIPLNAPRRCLDAQLAFVSEDRRGVGLLLDESLEWNIAFPAMQIHDKFLKSLFGGLVKWRDEKAIRAVTDRYIDELKIKCTSSKQKAKELSGGNQQKVCLAKAFALEPKFLFVSEPTRGIDVGAKYEIYSLMNDLSDQGIAIIMISSDLPEILGMSDRVAVFKDGRVTAVLDRKDADSEIIMKYATGKLS